MTLVRSEATLDLGRGLEPVRFAFNRTRPVQGDMANTLHLRRLYEPATSRLLMAVLKPGDTFVDVGAHCGYFSMLAGRLVGPMGRVLAFEPNGANYLDLCHHVHLNAMQGWVWPFQWALGRDDGFVTLHTNADNDGGHALWEPGTHPLNVKTRAAPSSEQVVAQALDDLFYPARQLQMRDVPPIKALKIDTEGCEHLVLHGAARTLADQAVPFVVAEINRTGLAQMGTSEQALRADMTDAGYETWLILEDEGRQLLKLDATEVVDTPYVFNLAFRRSGSVIG